MSDCFSHVEDAFNSLGQNHQDTYTGCSKDSDYLEPFEKNKLYYHKKFKCVLKHATEKAYLFKAEEGLFWVAKSLCKRLRKKSIYIHQKAKIKYFQEI